MDMIINICWTKQVISHTSLLSATLIYTPFFGDMVNPCAVFNGTCTRIEVIIYIILTCANLLPQYQRILQMRSSSLVQSELF